MLVFVVPILAGVAAGYTVRGRLANLLGLKLSRSWLLWLALAVAVLPGLLQQRALLETVRAERVLASLALVAVWLALNARQAGGWVRAGLLIALAGWALNTSVIAANRGAMPVEASSLAAAAPGTHALTAASRYKHRLATGATSLRALDDRIAVRPLAAVASAGDLLLLIGLATVIGAGMRSLPGTRWNDGPVTCEPPPRGAAQPSK